MTLAKAPRGQPLGHNLRACVFLFLLVVGLGSSHCRETGTRLFIIISTLRRSVVLLLLGVTAIYHMTVIAACPSVSLGRN